MAASAHEAAAASLARPYRAGVPVPLEESEAADYSRLPSDRQQADAGEIGGADAFVNPNTRWRWKPGAD